MYKQVRGFNQASAGKDAGWCLRNVQRGFNIPGKYPCAWSAWQHTQQHTGTPPPGVDVPAYFSYKDDNNGHIGVRLANGSFWSDGNIYPNIEEYQAHHAPRYVGWGESVEEVRVLEQVPDPAPSGNLPAVGATIHLVGDQTRTTWVVGTSNVAGHIVVTDNTFYYTIRGYDTKYPGRIIINSAMGGGNGVGLALYYLNGTRIDGWQ